MAAVLEYTDQEDHRLLCYSLEEVLIEKLRAVMQRLPKYKALWEKSISEQIRNLPSFEQVERETLRQLRKLV
jgi:predicted nucleotidyltransferase